MREPGSYLQQRAAALAFLALLSFVVSLNALGNGFVWEDHFEIVQNPYLRHWFNLKLFFTPRYFEAFNELSYRPLLTAFRVLDYSLWGLNPFGYHLTSLLFHVFNVLLLYLLIDLIFDRPPLSLLTAALFATHPIHTEAVAAIEFRSDLLASCFLLGGLIGYRGYRVGFPWITEKGGGRAARVGRALCLTVSLVCYGLSLLSKEVAIVLPLLLILHDRSFPVEHGEKGIRQRLQPYTGYLIVSLFYLVLRFYLFYNPQEDLVGAFRRGNLGLSLPAIFQLFALYGRLLLLPLELSADHPAPRPSSLFDPAVLLSLGLVLAVLGLSLWGFRRHRGASFALLWAFVTLLPVSNLIPTASPPVAERFLYLPSVGYCLALALGITRLSTLLPGRAAPLLRGLPLLLSLLILLAYSVLTVQRNAIWRDDYTLFSDTVQKNPASALAHLNLGTVLLEKGRFREAIDRFQQALALDPHDVTTHLNLARTYQAFGQWDRARSHYREASRRVTDNALFHLDLGTLYEEKGLYPEATAEYEMALRIDPRLVQLREKIQALRAPDY